ncbi:hypothetical protein [Roseivivax sp. CAU 1761]
MLTLSVEDQAHSTLAHFGRRTAEMSRDWFAARNQFAIMFGERFDA